MTPPYSIEAGMMNDIPVHIIRNNSTDLEAVISNRGANLLSLTLSRSGQKYRFIDGYQTLQELIEGNFAKSRILAPFSNRIAHNTYRFGENFYKFNASLPVSHGFLKDVLCIPEKITVTPHFAEIIFVSPAPTKEQSEGYPFEVSVRICYKIEGDSLLLSISGTNTGQRDIPFFCGWHPYFTLNHLPLDQCKISHEMTHRVIIDNQFIPLPSTRAYERILQGDDDDFSVNSTYADRVLNVCLCRENNEQPATTYFSSELNNCSLRISQPRGVLYLFDKKRFPKDNSTSIAIEPVESITDSFNRPDCLSAITLFAGQSRSFTISVTPRIGIALQQ